jgi:hypothetical protein
MKTTLHYDEWPLFIYLLDQAYLKAKPNCHGTRYGLWIVWSKGNLMWNGQRAGLVKFAAYPGESIDDAAERYSNMFGFELTAFDSLSESACVWDTFGTHTLVRRGEPHLHFGLNA